MYSNEKQITIVYNSVHKSYEHNVDQPLDQW